MNDREQLLLEQWKMASQLHQHMDNVVWRRASYFVAVNGILLAILGSIASVTAFMYGTPLLLRVILVAVPFFGALISWVWAVVQKRAQLYRYYRTAQAKQAEEALTVNGERVLTLHEKNLNEQELDDPYLDKFKPYLDESWIGKMRTHDLVSAIAIILTTVWVVLLPLVLWYTFRSAWGCVLVSVIPAFLWLWLVWDACLLPHMKRSTDQADA
jgi:ABC-type multidrug transport system fused ATPase/permease subunit